MPAMSLGRLDKSIRAHKKSQVRPERLDPGDVPVVRRVGDIGFHQLQLALVAQETVADKSALRLRFPAHKAVESRFTVSGRMALHHRNHSLPAATLYAGEQARVTATGGVPAPAPSDRPYDA